MFLVKKELEKYLVTVVVAIILILNKDLNVRFCCFFKEKIREEMCVYVCVRGRRSMIS